MSAMLISFYQNIFVEFATTGGRAHHTFRTNANEPKKEALQFILKQRQNGETIHILAQQWWLHWPLKYLSYKEPGVLISFHLSEALEGLKQHPGVMWVVEFTNHNENIRGKDALPQMGMPYFDENFILDAKGEPVVSLLRGFSDENKKREKL